ncbi:MAG: FapA family protein, partial [Candidatus Cloacimonadaceae bacterium]
MENTIYSPSGNISLRINDDKMSAWMYVHKSDKIIDEREILDLILEAGITNGFEEAIQWMAENGYNKDYEKPFPVAICKASASIENIEIHFNRKYSYSPDEKWNIRDFQNWTLVEKDTILADIPFEKINASEAVHNIFGELTTNVASAEALSGYLGQNVSLDQESQRIVSDIIGYPFVDKDNKINVVNNLVYKGDIKLSKMPVTLAASLTVEGSINKANLFIMSDLYVKGSIYNSDIYAEGELTIEGDIVDCQAAGVVTSENLKVKNIKNSLVMCRGELSFDNYITGSRVIAEKKIIGNPENSVIDGSQVMTSGSVDISSAGSVEGNETEIEVTISPFIKERMNQMNRNLNKLKENSAANPDKIEQMRKKFIKLEEGFAAELDKFLNTSDYEPRHIRIHDELF